MRWDETVGGEKIIEMSHLTKLIKIKHQDSTGNKFWVKTNKTGAVQTTVIIGVQM